MIKKSVEDLKSYWDQRIEKSKGSWEGVLWEGLPTWNEYIDKLQIHRLKRIFNMVKPSDMVLDLGCGVGRFTFRLANLCKDVYGVDSSNGAIKICKRKAMDNAFSNAKFEVMDVRELNFDDETFDWVLSVTCLQHVTNETDLITSIQEVLRVTKKNGKVILLECTSDERKDEFVVTLPRKKWFKNIKNAGGRIEDWYGVDIPFLRRIIFLGLSLTRKIKIERLRKSIEYGLICLLKPFEYTIPKILKNRSWYTVVIISKQIDESDKKVIKNESQKSQSQS